MTEEMAANRAKIFERVKHGSVFWDMSVCSSMKTIEFERTCVELGSAER
jgi:hypothetical protein